MVFSGQPSSGLSILAPQSCGSHACLLCNIVGLLRAHAETQRYASYAHAMAADKLGKRGRVAVLSERDETFIRGFGWEAGLGIQRITRHAGMALHFSCRRFGALSCSGG